MTRCVCLACGRFGCIPLHVASPFLVGECQPPHKSSRTSSCILIVARRCAVNAHKPNRLWYKEKGLHETIKNGLFPVCSICTNCSLFAREGSRIRCTTPFRLPDWTSLDSGISREEKPVSSGGIMDTSLDREACDDPLIGRQLSYLFDVTQGSGSKRVWLYNFIHADQLI